MKCHRFQPAASIKSPFHITVGTPYQPYTLSSNATQRPTSGAIHKHKLLFKRVTLYLYILRLDCICTVVAALHMPTKNVRTLSRFHITQ